jgi:hypothetical protein
MMIVADAMFACVMMLLGLALVGVLDGWVFGHPNGLVGGVVGLLRGAAQTAPMPPRADAITLSVAPLLALVPSVALAANLPWRGASSASSVVVVLMAALPSLSVAVVPLVGLAGAVKPTLLDALSVAMTRLLLWSVWVAAIVVVLVDRPDGIRTTMAALVGAEVGVGAQPLAAVASLVAIALWEAVERRPRGLMPAWFAGTSGAIRVGLRVARAAERWVLCTMWVAVFAMSSATASALSSLLLLLIQSAAVVVITAIMARQLAPRRIENCVWVSVVVLWPMVLLGALLPMVIAFVRAR